MAKRIRVDGLTQAEVAALLGKSTQAIAQWASRGMPGERGKYSLPEIVQWAESLGPWKRGRSEDDPLLDGDDSPALERYRAAKAELAELDAAERKRQVISVERLRGLFLRWASPLRNLGERLQKRFGVDAGRMVNETLDQCEGIIGDEFGAGESAD